MKKIVLLLLLSTISIYSQDFSVGLNYSGLISGKNYSSASLYTLDAEYEFIPNTLSAGFSASIGDNRIIKTFINNPPPNNPYETSFKLGIQTKYFPIFIKKDSFTLKPFIGIEFGVYSTSHIVTYLNMPPGLEYLYTFESQNDFYTNLNIGGIIFPEQSFSFVFGLKYQINNPTIKYEKPNLTVDGGYNATAPTEYTEKVNLNMLLWTIGFRINL